MRIRAAEGGDGVGVLAVVVVDRWFYDASGRRCASELDVGGGELRVSGLAEASVADAAVAAGYRRWRGLTRSRRAAAVSATSVAIALKKGKGVTRRPAAGRRAGGR